MPENWERYLSTYLESFILDGLLKLPLQTHVVFCLTWQYICKYIDIFWCIFAYTVPISVSVYCSITSTSLHILLCENWMVFNSSKV